MDKVLTILSTIKNALASQQVVIATVLGVLFALSKMISNEKAGPIVSTIQTFFDKLGDIAIGFGNVCKKFTEFLAQLIKSDGILGKK